MRFPSPAHHRTVAEFRAHLKALDPDFDCVDAVPAAPAAALSRPLQLDGWRIGNRFACHPMEGWDGTADGQPSEHTLRRWRRFGASGAKLIWGGEAFAVSHEGRANPHQLFWNPAGGSAGALANLRAAVCDSHRETGGAVDDLLVGLQLTHSGRLACPDGSPAPRIAVRRPLLERRHPAGATVPPLSDAELEGIGAQFVTTAMAARDAGFDFVDIKCCHGYLLHELIGAQARPGPYGGDFAGRTRLLRRIVAEIRSAAPGLGIGVRVSIADTVPFVRDPASGVGRPMTPTDPCEALGFGIAPADSPDPTALDPTEGIAFLRLLEQLGVRLVNVTLGSPYSNPHLTRPAAYPPSDGYLPPIDPLLAVLAHLRAVRACKAACPGLTLVGSGYTYLQEFLPHLAEAEVAAGRVDFVGLGRMLLSYPELPRDVLAGLPLRRKLLCRTFSDCT
ncbi:MAG: NADH:flavin oxidoreductase, partial [Planctomycetes bacterium]|nr:NADH:flavin oxidoreductase [Planctomycetota bacterium]